MRQVRAQHELTDFALAPEEGEIKVANRVEPGKRPRSSMAPMLVFGPDGTLFAAVGPLAAAASSASSRRRWWR